MFIRHLPKYRYGQRVFNRYTERNADGILQPMSELSVACIVSDRHKCHKQSKYSYFCTVEDQVFDMPEYRLLSTEDIYRHQRCVHTVVDTCVFFAKFVGFLLVLFVIIYLLCLSSVPIG